MFILITILAIAVPFLLVMHLFFILRSRSKFDAARGRMILSVGE